MPQPPLMPVEIPLGRIPVSLPVALRAGAQRHAGSRITFHGAAGAAEVTPAGIYERACSVASGLAALGIGRGDVVAVQLPPRVEAAVAQAAVLMSGAVLLPVFPSSGEDDLRPVLRASGAAALITSARHSYDILRARDVDDGLTGLRHVIAVSGAWPPADVPADALDWYTLERFRPLVPQATVRGGDDVCLMVYAPNPAGTLRGVRHTHSSMHAELATMPPELPATTHRRTHLVPLAPADITGVAELLRPLVSGRPTVFVERRRAETAVELIHRHGVTTVSPTCRHLSGLLDAVQRTGRGVGALSECVVTGTGPTRDVVEQSERLGVVAYGTYGSAEHSTITSGSPRDPLSLRASGTGRPLPGSRVRIVDPNGQNVPIGREGLILSRGPELFAARFDRLKGHEPLTADGWFRTGDIGRLDAEGYLAVKSRQASGTPMERPEAA
ncbi:AMP-binding protein [Streptomyces sp. NPDC051572]|uniref:AMP-binding protein n=1 Tax=unclassified Streptomyces TaxID=2593676 RepID=UPI00344C1454